jgi:peroxiredoxin/outer membrane lipoprotein-sorting protein
MVHSRPLRALPFLESTSMKPQTRLRFRWTICFLPVALLVCFAGLVLPGCGEKAGTTVPTEDLVPSPVPSDPAAGAASGPAASVAPSEGTAEEIMKRMIQAYKSATSYRDAGIIEMSGTQNGQRQQMTFPNAVVMQRPNKIRMEIDNGTLLSDGVSTYGFARNLPGQILRIPAPSQMTIKSLFPDGLLWSSMMQSPARPYSWLPIQLVLLLSQDPMKTLALDAQGMNLLEPAAIGQHPCDRVQLLTSDGPGVFWIDQATSVLRRFEMPADAFRREAETQQFLDATLVMEFRDAQLGVPIAPEAFQFQVPSGMTTSESLVMPILKILGQPCPDFQFLDTEGKTTALSSLQGKVVVIQLWSSKIAQCRPVLQAASKAYSELQNREDAAFMAVNIEPINIQNSSLQAVLKDWSVELPIYRDPQQSVTNHFGITLPATIILDKKGNIQSIQGGMVENMDALVARVVERLQKGEEVYQAAFKQFDNERASFQMMIEQSVADDIYVPRPVIPRAKVAERSEPENLKITKLWSCDQLEHPGNITVVPTAGGLPRILVMDDLKSVVELKTDGTVAATHALELQGNEVVTVLRTDVDKNGKRYFLGTARGIQRIHLFDDNFKTLLAYPDVQHPGIVDAQLTDLTGDGTPEMVLGYGGAAGVHAVDLQGNRLWSNNSMVDAIRVAPLSPDSTGRRKVLAMNGGVGGGTLIELDSEGKRVREITVPGQSVGWVVADDLNGNGTSEICVLAMAMTPEGQPASGTIDAMGIDLGGRPLWRHPLARGVHQEQIEPVTAGSVFPSGPNQWLIASADGTIRIVAADGQLIDTFAYGAALSGIATAQWDDKPVLLVATPQAVDAWQIQSAQ